MSKMTKKIDPEKIKPAASDKSEVPNQIAVVLKKFLRAIDDYRDAVNIAMPAVVSVRDNDLKRALARLQKYESKVTEDGKTEFRLPNAHGIRDVVEATREIDKLSDSRLIPSVAKSLFIGVFSEYDSFIGALLKAIYTRKPALFRGIKREISLNDLLEFESLEAVKQDVLEKEIESFRRESYVAQFSELERRFDFATLRDFPEWPKFVEMSQRRNLLTHNDGCVNEQYLKVCGREKFAFSGGPKIGDRLDLNPEYMRETLLTVSKVGFMLTHTLWRKILPEDVSIADAAMNEEIYDLLFGRRWVTAREFGSFGLSKVMTHNTEEVTRLMRVVNTANAYCRAGQKERAFSLLDAEDLSACALEFKLANAVLREQYSDAIKVMKNIGKKGEFLSQVGYHTWPLFEEFRKTTEFQEAYETIYNMPFLEKAAKDAQAQVEKLMSENDKKSGLGKPKPRASSSKKNKKHR